MWVWLGLQLFSKKDLTCSGGGGGKMKYGKVFASGIKKEEKI
jgi:hypothetical protein